MESLKRHKASLKRRLELPHALTLHAVNQPQLHLRHPLLLLRLGLGLGLSKAGLYLYMLSRSRAHGMCTFQ